MFGREFNFICLDWDCPYFCKEERVERKKFFGHVLKKSSKKLLDILVFYRILEFPEVLDRYSLTNLVTDYSKKPVSSLLIQKRSL